MMVDPQRLPHAAWSIRRRRARRWRADRRSARPSAARPRRARPSPTSIGSIGATATAICSAIRPPTDGREQQFQRRRSAGRPAATSGCWSRRMRCWARSYQPWPPSRARTCIIRILSSVSPSAKMRIAPQRSIEHEGGDAEPEGQQPPAPAPVQKVELPARSAASSRFLFFSSLPSRISRCPPKGKRAHRDDYEADRRA